MDTRTGQLSTDTVTLRELQSQDAHPLYTLLTTESVARFIAPPPKTVDGFGRFIAWTGRQREAGRLYCFGIVPKDSDTAVGLIQIRPQIELGTAEWGFALSEKFWGKGLFVASAELVMRFVFETAGIHRLEARTAVGNERGNGVLKKLGATREALLRRAMHKNGEYLDQALWSILADEWNSRRSN